MLYDTLVIGAGIAGASLAYRLPTGSRTLILEQESQPGYHSTGRSAAILITTYGTPTIRALTVASQDFYKQPPDGFSDDAILDPRGVLYIATAEQQALLQQAYEDFRRQGLDIQLLTFWEAMDRVPCLRADTLAAAMLESIVADIDVHGLHQSYLRAARQQGAELRLNATVARASWDGQIWTVTLEGSDETLQARRLVNAAGAWADTIAERCGIQPLDIQPRRRSGFLFSPPEGVDHTRWPAVMDIGETFYFKPDAGMLMGSPANADPVDAHDVVAEELDIATGIYHIEERTSLRIRRPSHTWAGLRSFAPDEEFVIGPDTANPAFFWLAGQGGYGIQTAAGVSLLAASLLAGDGVPDELANLGVDSAVVSPARFN